MKHILTLMLMVAMSTLAFANTPGAHTVKLTWTASPTTGVTYNVYRGPNAGVCSNMPSPYATGVTGTTFIDMTPPTGTVYYNVSAVGTGGESTCDGEVQITVPPITTQPPTGLSATGQ